MNHAKVALKELAHFHALGIAMNIENPEFLNEVKNYTNIFPFKLDSTSTFANGIEHMCDVVCDDPEIIKYADRIRKTVGENRNWEFSRKFPVTGPWITVTHGDFWVNNILFCEGNNSRLLYTFEFATS